MRKIINILFIINCFGQQLYSQDFRILNDSNSLKKDLFKEVFETVIGGNKERVFRILEITSKLLCTPPGKH